MNDSTSTGESPINSGPVTSDGFGTANSGPLSDAPIAEEPDLSEQLVTPTPVDEPPPLPGEAPAGIAPDDAPEAAATTAEQPAPLAPPESRRLARGDRERVERTRQRFAACGRCGYLIADLQLLLGAETLQEAALDAHDGWLRLESGPRLRVLLSDAFGVRLDLDYDGMDGACPECRRRFVFTALDDDRARLKLHL